MSSSSSSSLRRRLARVSIDDVADVPELAEVAAALIGRELPPQQFARHLVIQADHVRLDESLVGLHQRDGVVWNQLEVRGQELR